MTKRLEFEKIALIGVFGAISVVLGILENFLPIPIPGIRLGLANLAIMIVLYFAGIVPAMMVMILKVTLVPILSGNVIFRLSLALPSGVAAFIGMLICFLIFRRYVSAVAIGVVGAIFHMITQLWVIDHLYIKGIFASSMLGWFLLAAVCTGMITGVITNLTLSRMSSINLHFNKM